MVSSVLTPPRSWSARCHTAVTSGRALVEPVRRLQPGRDFGPVVQRPAGAAAALRGEVLGVAGLPVADGRPALAGESGDVRHGDEIELGLGHQLALPVAATAAATRQEGDVSSGEFESRGEVARQRDDGDVDISSGQPGGARREDPVAGADGHTLEPFVHPLILQHVEEGQVGSVRPGPPEVPRAPEREGHGGRGVVAAGDDVLGIVEPGHDLAQGGLGRLDLFAGRARGPREVLDVDQDQLPSCLVGNPCVRHADHYICSHVHLSSPHVHIFPRLESYTRGKLAGGNSANTETPVCAPAWRADGRNGPVGDP